MIFLKVGTPLLLLFLLTSCMEEKLELWVSKSETSIYLSPEGDSLQTIHTISKGIACVSGKVTIEKVYQYIEVLCEDGSYGWVVDSDHFNIVYGK